MVTTDDVVQSQYLTCRIADEEYGVGILEAREILEYETLTQVPNAPPFVRGVMDLAIKFGEAARPLTNRSCIIIVETQTAEGRMVVGLVADAVSQVIELTPDQIEPPPSFGTRAREAHLRGLGRAGNRFVLLLALDRILAEAELVPITTEAPTESNDVAPDDPSAAAQD